MTLDDLKIDEVLKSQLQFEAMDMITQFIDVILHLDQFLNQWVAMFGPWMYVILFLIIFCETGLVVTPFLPGDSLLFALGALCATENSVLNIYFLGVLLIAAGIIGDATNYAIGRYFGPKVFQRADSRFLKQEYLLKTQAFYEKHGGKTIILARYAPIIRTFAPFVAGVGKMNYPRFFMFNVVGAISWVGIFLFLGYFFGNMPIVKKQFHFVLIGIVIISIMPMLIEFWKARRQKAKS